jgi:hypothetical protein
MKPHYRKSLAAFIVALTLFSTGTAWTDCLHNGVTVPEGTRIGALVCRDGKWVEN